MLLEKKRIGLDELDAQTALELPDRELMLVTVVITNVLNNLSVDVDVRNNNVAVQVCAIAEIIDVNLLGGNALFCEIQQ